tara:strand:+ start:172 stop:357 length:186 start_codon:yes stop_codon:yes gene_type:complete
MKGIYIMERAEHGKPIVDSAMVGSVSNIITTLPAVTTIVTTITTTITTIGNVANDNLYCRH